VVGVGWNGVWQGKEVCWGEFGWNHPAESSSGAAKDLRCVARRLGDGDPLLQAEAAGGWRPLPMDRIDGELKSNR
jgi:hypothetical protein